VAVYKRGKVWWYKFQFNGESIQKSANTSDKEVAKQIESAHRVRLAKGEAGILERPAAPVFKEFAPRFIAAIETLCASKPQTVDFYKRKLRGLLKHEPIASTPLDLIDEAAIQTFKQTRRRHVSTHKKFLSAASVNRELATLRRLLRLAQEWKVIDRVPRIRLLSGEQGREFVLSYEQEKLYLGAASLLLRDMGVLMLDTGLRVGEAIHLEWPDVHLEPAAGAELGYLKVRARHSKNSKARNVPLTARVVEMLKGLGPHKAGYVFHRSHGQPVYQTWLNQKHSDLRALLKLPIEFVPHSFRHTYGTRLGESGADAFTIKQLMGHSSVTVSQKYVHPTPETVERAVQRLEKLNQGKSVKKLEESETVGTKMGTAKEAKIRKC